jgi:hypothetical protein
VPQREQRDRGADADAAGAGGDGGHRHQRLGEQREGAAEVELGQPRDVETHLVGERDQVDHLGVAVGVRAARLRRRLVEDPEAHAPILDRAGRLW